MNRFQSIIILLTLICARQIFAQLGFKITTNKAKYDAGEIIYITCTVSNHADSTVKILVYNYDNCQAEFSFDDYHSSFWTMCSPMGQELTFTPNSSRKYHWTFEPKKYGFPNKGGRHELVGYFEYSVLPHISNSDFRNLTDTLYIEAEEFVGGQLNVGYNIQNDSLVTMLKDSLNAEVINKEEYPYGITETWQVLGIQIDSLINRLSKDTRLSFAEYNRRIQYDSISTITSVGYENKLPQEYNLSNAYPNPFNPSTTIEYRIPASLNPSKGGTYVKLTVYDILGREVATLVNENKPAGNYTVTFNVETLHGASLPSGIYFYQLRARNYTETKKMVLMK